MALKGPIIIIEDDENDAEVITSAISDLGVSNTTVTFHTTREAYEYLCSTEEQPFIILCDIRMPGTNGLTFRKNIMDNDYLRKKSIPFIFLTGVVSEEIVNSAYDLEVQGFYQKASSYESLRNQLLTICMYWNQCLHPNSKIEAR